MNRSRRRAPRRLVRVLPLAALAVASSIGVSPLARPSHPTAVDTGTHSCPAGMVDQHPGSDLAGTVCVPPGTPESAADVLRADAQLSLRSAADGSVLPGANAAAIDQRQAIAALPRTISGTAGTWQQYGHGPEIGDDPRFSRVKNNGYADLNGRVNHFAVDPATGRLFASVGQGGVWTLDAGSTTWRSIGDDLPTQAVGGIAWSPAQGGTLLITTGNDVFGGGTTFAGAGAYRTTDLGRTWQRSSGIPDGVNSFQVAVDPTNASTVYAATGGGLFRSTDDGAHYSNVNLPVTPSGTTPSCNGALPSVEGCFLANIVTDVVVRAPGGSGADTSGGEVVAAVGWRAGSKTNTSQHYPSYVESPGNGLYRSTTGAPGSFTKIDTSSSMFADGMQAKIGRVELGNATGPQQDHGYLYAIVQDASGFQGQCDAYGLDAPGVSGAPCVHSTYLLGVYSSPDFGSTWTRMTTPQQLAAPGTGSSLSPGLACNDPLALYCPGVQAWYNAWIEPDPTQATSAGVPTRLVFGLEELWENRLADTGTVGASGPTDFKVIASYIGGTGCLFLVLSFPACPTESGYGGTTLHADQHGGLFLPDGQGGVTLYAGNDGGVGFQHVAAGQALSNASWGRNLNNGFNTLMPYSAVMAKDGTVYAGLQDNGELRIEPGTGKSFNTHDGDGTTSAVDPDNSNIVYERPAGASLEKSVDGGQTWTQISPSDTWQFSNPIAMDPTSSGHLLDTGNNVWETTNGGGSWTNVFALGKSPAGNAYAESALDVRSKGSGTLPTGPHTPDFAYTDGGSTVPTGQSGTLPMDVPGTYVDHPFTIGPNDGDATMTINVSWSNNVEEWDLYLYRVVNGSNQLVDHSTSGGTTGPPYQKVVEANPPPGDYFIRVVNTNAVGTFDATATFTQRTAAIAANLNDAAYVAVCGACDALNVRPFDNAIATNVGGSKPPAMLTGDGWHFAAANGLPKRYITSITLDQSDPTTVYVTLAGYSRRWLPPGAVGEQPDPRSGHVFKSTDAGEHFTDISGNLPDGPAESMVLYKGGLIIGTDTGVYISSDTTGGHYELLGNGLPNAPVFSVGLKPKANAGEPDEVYVATHGRGVYVYPFPNTGVPAVLPGAGSGTNNPAGAALPNTAAAGGAALLGLLGVAGAGLTVVARRRRRR
ncbi:MAG TPA: hypothetical protein VN193_00760 [Candidatus Angelobacter sp.]|nr:hypothetical protein [Candidatus Angelobacter sp.]